MMRRAVLALAAIGLVACIDSKAGGTDSAAAAGQQTQSQRVDMIQLDSTSAQPAPVDSSPLKSGETKKAVEPLLRDSASGPRHGIDSTGKRVPIKR
jgi:hypothetical protein